MKDDLLKHQTVEADVFWFAYRAVAKLGLNWSTCLGMAELLQAQALDETRRIRTPSRADRAMAKVTAYVGMMEAGGPAAILEFIEADELYSAEIPPFPGLKSE